MIAAIGSVRVVKSDACHLGRYVEPESAELAYVDPPFSVGVAFGARTKKSEVRARSNEASGPVAYDDKWESLGDYLAWLEIRLRAIWQLLAPTGTMWLHLDYRAVHEAKLLCDTVCGRSRAIGEVIWSPGNGAKSRNGPGITHQTLLLYAKSDEFIWNRNDVMLREPFAETSLAMHFKHRDDQGRAFRERVVNGKAYRYFADEGRAIGSIWADCPAMIANTPIHSEATGYPTQKPLKLLERIVRASSSPGGLVIDPFCGSGTTLHAAAVAGRRAVGCDIGALAIETTTNRLRKAGIPPHPLR